MTQARQEQLQAQSEISSLENIKKTTNIKENTWQLEFHTKEDVRSSIFDFAQENHLKILELKGFVI